MNLGSLLVQTLPIVLEGKTTGGSTSTVVDSSLSGKYDDDSFKEAIIMIRKTTDGLAPQNEFSLLSAFVDSTQTFTFSPVASASVGSGDYYAVADPLYPLATVLRLVNQALHRMGVISLVDTSLTALEQTLEYTLPLRLKAFPLDKVEIGNATDGWSELSDYYVLPAAPNSQSKLVFNRQIPFDTITASNYTLRLWYRDYHPELDTYDDVVSETIPEPLAIQYVKNELMEWAMTGNRLSPEQVQRYQMQRGDLQMAKSESRINSAQRKLSKFLDIGNMK